MNGKQKGSEFERVICKRLSLWVSGGAKTDLFWRSAMSGGRATVAHKRGEANRQGGDICSVSPEGHVLTDRFYLECKFYKDLCFSTFAINGKGPLAGFWDEAVKKAKQHEREPVLIAKQNNIPILVFTQFNSPFNKRPVARLHEKAWCDIGLLDRILSEKFDVL